MAVSNALNPAFNGGIKVNGSVAITAGSGAPTHSSVKGSLYIRTDGSSTSTRLYINTDGATTWTNLTSAA